MDHPMSPVHFRIMSAILWFRYRSAYPARSLAEAGVRPGDTVLDFGCGPGGFSILAARLVGPRGKVYALDIHPLAAKAVARKAERHGLANIVPITSDLATGLASESVDVVLLYDIFHFFKKPNEILAELSRVLKDSGVLSASDHHIGPRQLAARINGSGLFRLEREAKRTLTFSKSGAHAGNIRRTAR